MKAAKEDEEEREDVGEGKRRQLTQRRFTWGAATPEWQRNVNNFFFVSDAPLLWLTLKPFKVSEQENSKT